MLIIACPLGKETIMWKKRLFGKTILFQIQIFSCHLTQLHASLNLYFLKHGSVSAAYLMVNPLALY